MAERLRILVVGSGGREHAFAWKLAQSPTVDVVHVAPGNGGTDAGDKVLNVPIAVDDFTELVAHARKHGLNLVVVGPEAPLVAGIEGIFRAVGIRCFGPSKAAALMEGSKTFSKDFMQRHGIPTAAFRNFYEYEPAAQYLDSIDHNVVIKADGLAAGKGVIIPTSKQEAHDALKKIMVAKDFGAAGSQVVIEEFLEGEELSVLTFTDGYTIRSLPPAQDHKRVGDGDQGPNTGGMGCYAPTKVASKELLAQIDREIVQPTVDSMRRDGIPFVGILFTGIMLTKAGPKVLEYNVRGGDPETQTLLPLLSDDTDLAKVMLACTEHWLDGVELKVKPQFATTVVACAEGYPNSYAKNRPITVKEVGADTIVFHAGTSMDDKKLLSTGGRVIAATATADTLEEAVKKAYEGMDKIKFEGMHFRKDIAHRAFKLGGEQTDDTPLTYAAAGVSIEAGNSLVEKIKKDVKATRRPGADADLGGFGGLFDLAAAGFHEKSPSIVIATDGVGTKLKIAHSMDKHDTVGIDLVAMNVNDLVVQGAEPLAFVDCYTCSILDVATASSVVGGVAKGCQISHCTLLGGETAEMPGLLNGNEYDVTGTAIGAIDRSTTRLLPDKQSMVEGDVLLGLASNGVHSNGFSLVRRILERKHLALSDTAPWNLEESVGESLLTPTRIYVVPLLQVVKKDLIKGMAHITGGGLVENVPRMLPDALTAEIDVTTWQRPKVFDWLQEAGKVSNEEMSRTFNNGIGMVLVVSTVAFGEVKKVLEEQGETVYKIGTLVKRTEAGCTLKGAESWESS
ncbi:phosphoribosylamine-glycine ligase [Cyphellophora europaea CBS 101466]|uniref:Phosphoribosylamine-glycine ligase n=1 Tax=Cyphellophora europaea (strain CBS 101466) TaxID=1220924 RepID=W2RVB6_CYPE1|nr:phosphoribosylamine-glycine ligase [Cyphellophora europaea CBS 101466]ETN40362.1 phosphoribosylamine-glycine ligase [Cyphellophora europaea CBS 101466]